MKMSAVATPPMLCASGRGAVGVVPGAVVASGLSGRRPAAAPLFCLLLLLVFCLSALPARAHVVDELAPLLDSDAIVNSIQDIGLLKKAGFIYQPDLTITGEMCPVDGSQDQLAVLSGMLAADRMYAFYFGDVSDAAKKNELLQQLVGKPLPTLNNKDMARIRKAPHSQESANILARFRQQELSRLLEAARQDDQLLRLLGTWPRSWCWPLRKATRWSRSIRCIPVWPPGTARPWRSLARRACWAWKTARPARLWSRSCKAC